MPSQLPSLQHIFGATLITERPMQPANQRDEIPSSFAAHDFLVLCALPELTLEMPSPTAQSMRFT